MAEILVYPAGVSGTAPFAANYLARWGIPLVDHPTPEVTHLLLDVPTREIPTDLLEQLPETITVVGGNLTHPELEQYQIIDLLKLEEYLAHNAAITAECALRVATSRMNTALFGCSILVIGWGRIGKYLSFLLKQVGCNVTVAARKKADRAILEALGFDSADSGCLPKPERFHAIFNTVPALVLSRKTLSSCTNTLKIDLASRPGLEGPDVIWARGLPGLYAPDSSGKLIAETFLKEVAI